VDEGNKLSDMNGDDEEEMIMRANSRDVILHLLLGDIYLPYLNSRNFGEYLGCLFIIFFLSWDICPLFFFLRIPKPLDLCISREY